MACSVSGKPFADGTCWDNIFGVIAAFVLAPTYQITETVTWTFAVQCHGQGVESKAGLVGVHTRFEGGNQRAASGEIIVDLVVESSIGRDVIGQDEQRIVAEVGLRVDYIELVSRFLQHAVDATYRGLHAAVVNGREFFRRHDGDIAEGARVNAPGFFFFDLAIDIANQVVDLLFDLAIRRQLIANECARAHRNHAEAFVFKRFLILEGVEIAPGGVKLAGVAQAGKTQGAGIAHGQREVDITPSGRWAAIPAPNG